MYQPNELARIFKGFSSVQARAAWIAETVRATGRSRDYLYRLARQGGWKSDRVKRADVGIVRSGIIDDDLFRITRIKIESTRANGKQLISTPRAVSLLAGVPFQSCENMPSVSTFNRHLRRLGLGRKNLKRTRIFEKVNHQTGEIKTYVSQARVILTTSYPNQMHEVDTSICVLWRLGAKSNYSLTAENKIDQLLYKNKPANVIKVLKYGLKVIRYTLVDHCSSSLYWRYYEAGGENAADMGNFLFHAWAAKTFMPFHGVPKTLSSDAGAGLNNNLLQNLLERLEVEWKPALPGNKETNGAVEKGHDIVECSFESLLRFDNIPDLADLNALAEKSCAYLNNVELHSKLKATRSATWSMIPQEHLREIPPIWERFQALMTLPASRKVTPRGTIEFEGLTYRTSNPELVGQPVIVYFNPYKHPEIIVYHQASGYRTSLEPLPVNRYGRLVTGANIAEGTFDQPKETATVKNVRRALKSDISSVNVRGLLDRMAEEASRQSFIGSRKTGTDIMPDAPPPVVFDTQLDAKNYLCGKYGQLEPDLLFAINDLLPDTGITVDQAEQAYQRLTAESDTIHKEIRHA